MCHVDMARKRYSRSRCAYASYALIKILMRISKKHKVHYVPSFDLAFGCCFRFRSTVRAQLLYGVRWFVSASEPVKVSKQVAVVVSEQRVVHVVVSSSSHADGGESSVPWVHGLAVDQAEPVGVQSAKGHVGPHVDLKPSSKRGERPSVVG